MTRKAAKANIAKCSRKTSTNLRCSMVYKDITIPGGRRLPALLPGSQLGGADKADRGQILRSAHVAHLQADLTHVGHALLRHHVGCVGGGVQPVVRRQAGVAPLCVRHATRAVRLLHT